MDATTPDTETPSQRQARLRRERRQAKIATGGADRLAKITGVDGWRAPEVDDPPISRPSETNSPPDTGNSTSDADTPVHKLQANPSIVSLDRNTKEKSGAPNSQSGKPVRGRDVTSRNDINVNLHFDTSDPFQVVRQLLERGGDGQQQLPSALAKILGGEEDQKEGEQPTEEARPPAGPTSIWRVLHVIVSLMIAIYVITSFPLGFRGTKEARSVSETNWPVEEFGRRLFFWFATVEVVLQSSRYFLERGQLPRSGIIGNLASILPEPFSGLLRLIGRYYVILATLMQDALVIIFVLGVIVWWNGSANMIETR